MSERSQKYENKFKKQSTMLMSNSKWVKFFNIIMQFDDLEFFMKYIDNDRYRAEIGEKNIYSGYRDENTRYAKQLEVPFGKDSLGDWISGGPVDYSLIEGIIIPSKVYNIIHNITKENEIQIVKYQEVNLTEILAKLSKVGVFPIEHVINEVFAASYYPKFYEYLILRGYYLHSPPAPPKPRRGIRAKRNNSLKQYYKNHIFLNNKN